MAEIDTIVLWALFIVFCVGVYNTVKYFYQWAGSSNSEGEPPTGTVASDDKDGTESESKSNGPTPPTGEVTSDSSDGSGTIDTGNDHRQKGTSEVGIKGDVEPFTVEIEPDDDLE
jgi:hypothetical protein